MTLQTPPLEPAGDVRDLTQAEHLVLFGFRAMALGHGDCPALRRAYHGLLGPEAEGALCNLLVFVRMIGAAARRRVRLHPPGCCALSGDEQRMIDSIAAAQASLGGHGEADLQACMGELLAAPPSEAALMAGQAFAAALMLGGMQLRSASAPAVDRILH